MSVYFLLTTHARHRLAQRRIHAEAMSLALERGARIYQNGATLYFLGRRHLPDDLAPSRAERFVRTVVVVARDGTILTAFRTARIRRALHRRRPRRRRRRAA